MFDSNEGNTLYNTYSNPGALNVYIVGYLRTGFNGDARFPWTADSHAFFFTHHAVNTAIYAHEIGHYFGLFHTHETFQGTELVNGNNCSSAGDGLCDTPADPQITAVNVDSTCVYIGTKTDDNDACTINDVYDNTCQCSGTFQDSDNDGICDANDTNCTLIAQSDFEVNQSYNQDTALGSHLKEYYQCKLHLH